VVEEKGESEFWKKRRTRMVKWTTKRERREPNGTVWDKGTSAFVSGGQNGVDIKENWEEKKTPKVDRHTESPKEGANM